MKIAEIIADQQVSVSVTAEYQNGLFASHELFFKP